MLRQLLSIVAIGAITLSLGSSVVPAAPEPGPREESSLPPRPEGDRLVRLLKQIADEAVLIDPERMAKELNIEMKFTTRNRNDFTEKGCSVQGQYKVFSVTEATVGDSWFKPTPEGVQNMEVPRAFINPAFITGAPEVAFSLYRTVDCASPNYLELESTLSFANLSGFSCLTPDRLQKLIGAEYRMATDGVSISSYSPPPTEAYGVVLEFGFRVGAGCAVGASIRQDSRDGFRERRAFIKWRACIDKARADYCAAHPDVKSQPDGRSLVHDAEQKTCGDQRSFLAREPTGTGSPGPWPSFGPVSDNPCEEGAP